MPVSSAWEYPWTQMSSDYSWELIDDEEFTYRVARSYDTEGGSRWVTAWVCDIAGRLYLTIGGTYPTMEAAKASIENVAMFAGAPARHDADGLGQLPEASRSRETAEPIQPEPIERSKGGGE